ncbi:MAG: AGE family epimerase/isomerase [Lachnospiraceae bacterium]|nr:AGE family epimerase/isomerase [Ruminococcus sp.]MCM1274433.1 AGE family epimerase/isomerase [Lachnospiraceae bacterium]
MFKDEIKSELLNHIIPFWNALRDDEHGGWYGEVDSALNVDKKAEKGVILHSRILWFYSNAYMALKESALLDNARHAYEFLAEKCYDREYGGVYWTVNYDGTPADDMKHSYCQAFFIYALASYYRASGDKAALDTAYKVFELIEGNHADDVAYREKLSRDLKTELANDELSENGLMADKTMNTTLHLMEAYTELYLADKNERVLERLKFQMNLTYDKIFDSDRLRVFFDGDMNEIGDVHSYGHDIEATWLIDRAADVIGDEEFAKKFRGMNAKIAANIAKIAYDAESGSLLNESDKGVVNRKRVWWVQAETVVGFINAHQRGYGDYMGIAESVWRYIRDNVVDKRTGGEWFSELEDSGKPDLSHNTVDPWKCPYHNGRMCLEVMRRLG